MTNNNDKNISNTIKEELDFNAISEEIKALNKQEKISRKEKLFNDLCEIIIKKDVAELKKILSNESNTKLLSTFKDNYKNKISGLAFSDVYFDKNIADELYKKDILFVASSKDNNFNNYLLDAVLCDCNPIFKWFLDKYKQLGNTKNKKYIKLNTLNNDVDPDCLLLSNIFKNIVSFNALSCMSYICKDKKSYLIYLNEPQFIQIIRNAIKENKMELVENLSLNNSFSLKRYLSSSSLSEINKNNVTELFNIVKNYSVFPLEIKFKGLNKNKEINKNGYLIKKKDKKIRINNFSKLLVAKGCSVLGDLSKTKNGKIVIGKILSHNKDILLSFIKNSSLETQKQVFTENKILFNKWKDYNNNNNIAHYILKKTNSMSAFNMVYSINYKMLKEKNKEGESPLSYLKEKHRNECSKILIKKELNEINRGLHKGKGIQKSNKKRLM